MTDDKKVGLWTDDSESLVKYHHNDDNPCYTGNSITEILADYNRDNLAVEHYLEPADFWYHTIAQGDDWNFADREITKPRVGCLYCHQEITLNTGCYLFCRTRHQYDRNISLVVCSDACPVAMNRFCNSKCQICQRDYIHDRYDNEICRLCAKK